jgi:hypothetical protein
MSQLAPDHKKEGEKEKTEVLYGVENAVGRGVRFKSPRTTSKIARNWQR